MNLTFLKSSEPLTKSYIRLDDGSIEKTSYPNVWEVTSIIEECSDLKTFEALLNKHAAQGHCLLKGMVSRELVNESRAGTTDRNEATQWLCLDIDGIDNSNPSTTIDSILQAMGLGSVSYILQWSGSMGISPGLRCHVFMLLTQSVSAPLIKQWLIQKNHEVPVLRAHHQLTKTGNSLTWGLDVTACQADKLIYIAPPVLKNIKNPLGRMPRVSLEKRGQDAFDFNASGRFHTTSQNKLLTEARVIELRKAAGMPDRKFTYKQSGPHEVLAKPDECIATEIKQDRGFVYFNLNGGDSWAYYHPENNPEYIYNFKGEPIYLTRELLPSYWEQLKATAYRTGSNGVTYLAFLDRQTSTYWRGTYIQEHDLLDIYQAKTETMLRHFAVANGMPLGDYIPEWDMKFDPHDIVRVDFTNRSINTFQQTPYMMAPLPKRKITACHPIIFKVISSILAADEEAIEHFMNWLAYIVQQRDRTRTAWVFQGIPGTGKGLLMNRVLRPLFGSEQTVVKRAAELNEKWTDYVAGKLIICIDEIQTSAMKDEAGVIANLKNLVTEPTVMVRVMNKNSYSVRNYANYLFFSNKPDPVSIDKYDRRINVGPYQTKKFDITDAELDRLDNELQDFYHYLEGYALDKQAASVPLQSSARSTLIELSQSTSESTAEALKEGDMGFFIDQLPTSDAYKADFKLALKVDTYRATLFDLIQRSRSTGSCNVKRDEIFVLFDYTVGGINSSPTTFTRFLGHRHVYIKPVSINSKTERGAIITWADHAEFPKYLQNNFSDLVKTLVPKAAD